MKIFIPFIFVLLAACSGGSETRIFQNGADAGEDFAWNLPALIPLPSSHPENPMTEAKFELGRHLFYDARLSGNGSQSCSSCHEQALAFSDGKSLAVGSTGETHPRNSQSLTNIAYNATLTWANPSLLNVEQQVLIPLFGEHPVEQGINDQNWPEVVARLQGETRYAALFSAAFPGESEIFTRSQIAKALAVFVRGLTSFDSAYDRQQTGESNAMSPGALRGQQLFFSERMECFHCHGGYNFSDSTVDRTMSFVQRPFHNTGLYNIDGTGRFPEGNRGLFELTGKATDMGKFRAPSLRNVAKTAPYMHDGSVRTLEDVLGFYAAGGRVISSGPHQGDGRKNPYKDGFVTGFSLSAQERSDLISFLESLTDTGFLNNPRYANPW